MMTTPPARLRFLFTADQHLGTPLKKHDRVPGQFANLKLIFQAATAHECAAVVVGGDLFWDQLANARFSYVVHELMEAMMPYVASGGHVLMLSGNHDSPMQFRAMQSTVALAAAALGVPDAEARVRFVTDPAVVMLPGNVQAVCLPYPVKEQSQHLVPANTPPAQVAAARNQAVVQLIAADFRQLLSTLDTDNPAVCFGHFHVETARMPAQVGEGFEHAWDRDFQVPKRLLADPRLSFVGLGHIHEMQRLEGIGVPMWYPGSSERLNSNEADTIKGVLLVDVPETGYATVQSLEIPCSMIRIFKTTASKLPSVLESIPESIRTTAYVKFEVALDGTMTRQGVRTAIQRATSLHFGIVFVEPAAHARDRAREPQPATARLVAANFEDTVRTHLFETLRHDPELSALLALAEDCMTEAKARGNWSHLGGQQAGIIAPDDTTPAPVDRDMSADRAPRAA